ncbi:uncharacterized protein LOC110623931 [Manihot esculenta]|uniref:Uncharacterized protein n=1 Tax=Manihot esculenta TaxID=3983 RepID=A0A2C9V3L5_MANES|nr:uncharacterized protein LOC110623931 [Manihot esculenta]OAY38939.1 hypothetical protein MANES_10G054600v8 [Manihot esculenta]
MAKAEIVTQQDSSEEPKNLFSFLKRFGLKLPVFNEDKKAPSKSVVKDEAEMAVGGDGEADNTKQRPNFVRFPNAHPIIPPPLDIELEESSGKTHNPVIIWQVYALGGFIILKWVWARWKERKERAKKASPDNDQPSDEYLSPPDDND